MQWEPIADIPEHWDILASSEVESLAEAWDETYRSLKDTSLVEAFNERLRREWSIETGIIERVYTIDRGTTLLLIEQGIDASLITHGATNRPVGEVIQIINDQREALDGLFAFVAQKEQLTLHYIRTLHQVLLRHQEYTEAIDSQGKLGHVPLMKGAWKKLPNNPRRPDGIIHEYCPPEQVQIEMERLLTLHHTHMQQGVTPEIEAAWLHHRFTQIHPFQDGNGRVARCLATLVLLRAGRFPLVVNRDQWLEYITALEEADAGNLQRLVKLFEQIEKRAYLHALELSEDITTSTKAVSDILHTIGDRYQSRQKTAMDHVLIIATYLHRDVYRILQGYATLLQERMQGLALPIVIHVAEHTDQSAYHYQADIVAVAKRLGYYANLTRPRLWVRLRLEDSSHTIATDAEIVVSFHYFGRANRGIMMITAFLHLLHGGSPSAQGERSEEAYPFHETQALVDEGFIITHRDEPRLQQKQQAFQQWLDQAIARGLTEWERQV